MQKPIALEHFSLCVTGRYLYLDLSFLFNIPPGIDRVATNCEGDSINILFNWLPGYERHLDKIMRIPHEAWWDEMYREAQHYNSAYKAWVKSKPRIAQ